MRGGKFLGNWRMAELHAREAPERVWELETYGACSTAPRTAASASATSAATPTRGSPTSATAPARVDPHDATEDRRPPAGGLRGDRGLRGPGQGVLRRVHRQELLKEGDRSPVHSGTGASRPVRAVRGAGGGDGDGGHRQVVQVTSNSWEYTGDGHALALRAGANLINMEFVQSIRPGWCGRRASRASSSPRASAATAVCSRTPTASAHVLVHPGGVQRPVRGDGGRGRQVVDDPDTNRRTPGPVAAGRG
ncbi:hypothetical protein GS436_17625, partial [Rhodococcus hoagii]|nr:hypothetical protein [Prescottella equi]